ncbi:MAG TPA: hypothetical protein DD835_13230 [Halomonas sp.]|nr:hypothetical protein [Halomonas sp.]
MLSGTLSDYAYSNSYQIQWATFASWLNAGGLVFVLHPTLGKANRKFSLFFLSGGVECESIFSVHASIIA